MGSLKGFLEVPREKPTYRGVEERLRDYEEVELPQHETKLRAQASRCMDCGIPFCHQGCPLGNLIPDWNDQIFKGRWQDAAMALHATNNFPEVTGRVCPAPCEASCVLNLENAPVSIKAIEKSIADATLEASGFVPQVAAVRTGKSVAVVGSGPAGLAAAQQLARKGHRVTVLEKADRIGGLLRYGIPDFKLDKALLDLRIDQMLQEGVVFKTGVNVGKTILADELRRTYDAVLLCGGAMKPRDLKVPGRELRNVHFAMDFLTQQNRRVAGDLVPDDQSISAKDKHVIILGGGDTGSDCVGTSLRQGAKSVTSLELMPRPPDERRPENPWPAWPIVFRTSSSHEEGGVREFAALTTELTGEYGMVRKLRAVKVTLKAGAFVPVEGSEFELPCDLLLLAMGFEGPVREGIIEQLGVKLDARGNVATSASQTSVKGVFAAGDMSRGQSLVVWAIAEGRKAADAVDSYLAGV